MTYWYISFATSEGFRGATIVEADSAEDAFNEATKRNLNPGGEAAIMEVPTEAENEPYVQAIINRLASREELIAMGGRRQGDLPEEVQDAINDYSDVVCEDCNVRRQ